MGNVNNANKLKNYCVFKTVNFKDTAKILRNDVLYFVTMKIEE